MAIMKLDILEGLKTIKVCTGYTYKGKTFSEVPYDLEVLEKARPIYRELSGWQGPLQHIRAYRDLPVNARRYLSYLEDILGARISMVSVGSSRDETICI
jgi:adenylosuccinate synthase